MGGCFSVAFNGENNSGIWQKLLHALKIFSKKSGKNDPAEAVEFEEVEERKKRKLSTKKAIISPPRKRREIPPKIELNEEIIEEFIELEKSLRRLERRGIVEKFEAKSTEIDELRRTLTQMEATQKELKKGTEKTRADLDNLAPPGLKLLLRRLGTMDERMENGRKQFDEALAKEEMAEKELNATKREYANARKIADLYGEWANRMMEMFGREQQILGGLFGEEFVGLKQLDELDAAIEWQQRIEMAKFKWTNARILLVHASTQIAFGISHWKELSRLDPLNASRMRYFSAVEARNNFQLAAQNIQTCRVYLDRIKFPYGTEEEMQQMENALQTAFNDVQSNAALKRALTICQGIHKSVHSLIIWFDKVIAETILKDLDKANANVSKRQKQIRELGLEMMGKLVREKFGRELRIDDGENEQENKTEEAEFEQRLKEIEEENELKYEEENRPAEGMEDEDDEKMKLGGIEKAEKKPDGNEKKNGEGKISESEDNIMEEAEILNEEAIPNVSSSNNSNYAPIPLNQLAPIPSKDVLFEEIQQKLNKFEQIRTTKERWNDIIRERQRLALQEKLRIRLIQKRQQRRKLINRRKSSIQPFPSSFSQSIEEFTSSSSQN